MLRAAAEAFIRTRQVTGVRGLSVYLSGPTRGLFDYPAFYDAARILLAAGAAVSMPHDPTPGLPLRSKLKINVAALLAADLLLLLEGWEGVPAVVTDIITADGAGIPHAPLAAILI